MAIRPAEFGEETSLNSDLGNEATIGAAFTPNQENLVENTYRNFFSVNYLPTLIANAGTWYLIAELDQGFLRKAAALLDSPRPIAPGYQIQCRTQEVGDEERRRRAGNLWVRVLAV